MINPFIPGVSFSFHQSYLILYILMIIEGPIVNAAASFAASLGYLNLFIIWIIAFLADLTADIFYYSIGRLGNHFILEKYENFFKMKAPFINKIKEGLAKHSIKTIIALKLTPFFSSPGLIIIGSSKIPFKKYVLVSSLTIIPMILFFSLIGYYFGVAFSNFYNYFGSIISLIITLIFLIIILPFIFRWIIKKYIKIKI